MAVEESTGDTLSEQTLERLESYTVVDVDMHEVDIPHMRTLHEELEEPWRSKLKHINMTDEPLAGWLIGSAPGDIEATPPGLGKADKVTQPEGLKAAMERLHTDYGILHGHQLEILSSIPEPEFASAICTAYNDFMLEYFCDSHEGLKSSIRVHLDAPRQAVEEIERLKDEDDMVSVHLVAGTQSLYGDPRYEPVYECAADVGLPIDSHIGFGNPPWAGTNANTLIHSSLEDATLYNQAHLSNVASLIFQGIPEKFPDLDFVFLEQGIAWIPVLQSRMDKTYERRKHDMHRLTKKPSEYLHDQFYFGTQPIEDPTTMGRGKFVKLLDLIDAGEMLMYSSDYPHYDFDYPSVLTFPEMDEDVERRIFQDNAMEVFDI